MELEDLEVYIAIYRMLSTVAIKRHLTDRSEPLTLFNDKLSSITDFVFYYRFRVRICGFLHIYSSHVYANGP